MKIGITYHNKFQQYDLGPDHPFRGSRFIDSMAFFKKMELLSSPDVTILKPEKAARQDILLAHVEEYVDYITTLADQGWSYDIETPVSQKIYEALMLIIGGAIEAGDAVFEGAVNRAAVLGGGFHHAGEDFGGGFCLFNDVAILARHLQRRRNVKKVLIIDYDVHAGNGTSNIFYSDPSVLFIDLHQDPRTLFPWTGFIEQIGANEGLGYNVNIPLPPETSDQNYLYAFEEIVEPLAYEFKPDIILANGGGDAHFADSLGDLDLTAKGFFKLSKKISEISKKVCGGKMILHIVSGYNPRFLPLCWYALVSGMTEIESIPVKEPYHPSSEPPMNHKIVVQTLGDLKKNLRDIWSCFK